MKARIIDLKVLAANSVLGEPEADYRALFLNQLGRVDPQAGLDVKGIEERLAARKSLRAAGDSWLASIEEWTLLKTLLATERWAIVSENLMQMIRDVNDAPEAEIGTGSGLHLVKEV